MTYSVIELLVVVTVIGSNMAFLLLNKENYWAKKQQLIRIVFSNKQKYDLGKTVWHCFHCLTFNPSLTGCYIFLCCTDLP